MHILQKWAGVGHRTAAGTFLSLLVVACSAEEEPSAKLPPALQEACPALLADPMPDYWLCDIGDRRRMLGQGDLSASIRLSDIPHHPHLIAVGPVGGLQGEITVYNGTPIVSTMQDGQEIVQEDNNASAVFLAFGAAKAWEAVPLTEEVSNAEQLEQQIIQAAQRQGLDPDTAFPFRIEASTADIGYHVIFKSDDTPHNRAEHRRSKVPFDSSASAVKIAGVWADPDNVGNYTHEGRRIHLHVIIGDNEGSGHIDRLRIPAGATLFLPRVEG